MKEFRDPSLSLEYSHEAELEERAMGKSSEATWRIRVFLMEELTEFNQMNGYRDIQMIKVKANYKVLRATGSVVESFTEVRLRGR